MSAVSEPICFGDVVKLETKSAFVESGGSSCLGFLELPGKTPTQLLVVPPIKDEVADRFLEAEFIIAPIRGEKQQSNGTPLTYATPFVLRTSDGKDGSTYSLNNKVAGQRDAVSLQLSATKGEMYMQVEKEGCTNEATCMYGDDGLKLNVVDSNRIRKTLNHVLTHMAKPKSDAPGGFVSCGVKGQPLTFRIQRVLDVDGKPQTETRKYIKNPQARRSSMDALTPGKMDELSRADRIDSSEFSDVDALSRSSSVAGMNSNPASPRGGQGTQSSPVDPVAVAALLPLPEGKNDESGSEEMEATTSSIVEASASPSKTAAAKPSTTTLALAASPSKPQTAVAAVPTTQASPAKTAVQSTPSPVKTTVQATPSPAKEPAAVVPTASAAATTTTVPTFPPAPVIFGPAPAPVAAVSPKKSTTTTATAKPLSSAGATKLNEEEVAALKAEAEVEKMDPACAASCAVM